VHAAAELDSLIAELSGDEATGARIVQKALSAPAYWIAANAGGEGAVVVNMIASLPVGQGYDAARGEFVDLVAAGIVDPVKVTRSAVANAASIAGMVLTTETAVTEIKDEEPAAHAHQH
jgi:chaperonin GroEL